MTTPNIHLQVQAEIDAAVAAVLPWWDSDPRLRQWLPPGGGWSVQEVLDHITLTSHYLLILIDKGARKSINAKANGEHLVVDPDYSLIPPTLADAGALDTFHWHRPDHMDPRLHPADYDTRQRFLEQMGRCTTILQTLEGGWGHWYKTTMTVNALGKIDVYQYIVFLCRHAQRHCAQMQRNQSQFQAMEG